MSEALVTARQVSELIGFSPSTVVDWAEAGKIPSFKIGGRLRFRTSEIERWLEEHRRGPQPGSFNQPTGDPAAGFRV